MSRRDCPAEATRDERWIRPAANDAAALIDHKLAWRSVGATVVAYT
jgi:hypothetical protein